MLLFNNFIDHAKVRRAKLIGRYAEEVTAEAFFDMWDQMLHKTQ